MQIREITVADSEQFSGLLINLARESDYTLLTDVEYQAGAASQATRTQQIIDSPAQQIYITEDQGEVVGFIAASQGAFQRNLHVCSLMIGVRSHCQGKGAGSGLMRAALDWAQSIGIERTELTVAEDNAAAIALYQKFGFEKEGIKRDAYRVDGKPVNELMMARVVSQ